MKKYSRFIALCLALVFIFVLTACGSETSAESKFNAGNTALAKQAVNTVDSFLDGTLTASEAKDKIDTIYDQIDDTDEYQSFLSIYLLSLSADLTTVATEIGNTSVSDLIDDRDGLASYAGLDPYE